MSHEDNGAAPEALGEVGRKRARTEDTLRPSHLSNEDYLKELTAEYERHQKLEGADKMPHSERLVLAQIEAIKSPPQEQQAATEAEMDWNTDHGEGIRTELGSKEATGVGTNVKATLKIFIPEDVSGDSRGSSSRGRLLGPKGATIQRLQDESGCKIQIRGKGSVKFKDGSSEESHASEEIYAHLKEGLHVAVHHDGPSHLMDANFKRALRLVRTVVTGGVLQPAQPSHYDAPLSGHGPWGGGAALQYQGAGPGSAALTGGSPWQASSPADVAAAQAASRQGQIVAVVGSNKEMGMQCHTVLKMFVPQRTTVGDSRGKLLGQKGATLRQLQMETGMRMFLRGKGSMRLPEGENDAVMLSSDKYSHLKDELHVVMEYEGPTSERDSALNAAQLLVRSMLTPAESASYGQKHPMSQYEAIKSQQQQQPQYHQHPSHYQTSGPSYHHPAPPQPASSAYPPQQQYGYPPHQQQPMPEYPHASQPYAAAYQQAQYQAPAGYDASQLAQYRAANQYYQQ